MRSRRILDQLRAFESRNVTFIAEDRSWPIVWERARGMHVWDAEGRCYLDLTAAFGVAAAGHANPRVVAAGRRQMGRLAHAMGDVHPHALKAELAAELSRITFERWSAPTLDKSRSRHAPAGKTIFCNSGFEAVEAALKTALLATGKPGVIAFQGAYHGLGYGALTATHREYFRTPFRSQLARFVHFVPFPQPREADATRALAKTEAAVRAALKRHAIGAVLVEPVQGRGGIRIPPPDFLPRLRRLCDAAGALLILDEVFTGFGRTGRWFACEHTATIPDLICLGKALTGGFPLSACVGRAELMDAWPQTQGEALHTSTFLGHPVGCAMALAQIQELERRRLADQSARAGEYLAALLARLPAPPGLGLKVRNLGLMAGVEVLRENQPAPAIAWKTVLTMLRRGYIMLPEGEPGHILSLTPPLVITRKQLAGAVAALAEALNTAAQT